MFVFFCVLASCQIILDLCKFNDYPINGNRVSTTNQWVFKRPYDARASDDVDISTLCPPDAITEGNAVEIDEYFSDEN